MTLEAMRSTESTKACAATGPLRPAVLVYGSSKLQSLLAWVTQSRRWPAAYSLLSRLALQPGRVMASPDDRVAMQLEQLPEWH